MTDAERIAELEARVSALEARSPPGWGLASQGRMGATSPTNAQLATAVAQSMSVIKEGQ